MRAARQFIVWTWALGAALAAVGASSGATPAPKVTSFSPGAGPVGTVVTVHGSSLSGATGVRFGGTASTAVTSVTASTLRAVVPVGAGTGKVAVDTPGGSAESGAAFRVTPRIDSLSPDHALPGAAVVIAGHDFTGATKVTFNGLSAGAAGVGFTVQDDGTILATVPDRASAGKVAVTTLAGTGSSAGSFVPIRPPSISSFAPASAPIGAAVTIRGSNLAFPDAVTIGGTPVDSIQQTGTTQLTVKVAPGTTDGPVDVTNAAGEASKGTFRVAPRIDGFAPATGIRPQYGNPGTSVDITGLDLDGATKVTFNGVSAGPPGVGFTEDSPLEIHAFVPAGATTGKIAVTTPDGTGASALPFTVVLPPRITSFSPHAAHAGDTLTINGASLGSVYVVWLESGVLAEYAAIQHISDTRIAITIPPDSYSNISSGSGRLQVTNPADDSAFTSALFSILPTVDHFFPTAVARGNGDDQDDSNLWSFVNIYGSGLNGVTGVKFSGVGHFTGASRWGDDRLCAHVPPNATSGKVVVESGPSVTATSTTSLTIVLPPRISSISPTSGPIGTVVTVYGSNLGRVTTGRIDYDNATLALDHVVSDTQVKLQVVAAAGPGPIDVQSIGGSSAPSNQTFTVTGSEPSAASVVRAIVGTARTALAVLQPQPCDDYPGS